MVNARIDNDNDNDGDNSSMCVDSSGVDSSSSRVVEVLVVVSETGS